MTDDVTDDVTDELAFETLAVHAGPEPDAATGAVVPPVHLTSTFARDGVDEPRAFEYSRAGNPTRAALEQAVAALEGARHGFAFASGIAAVDAVLRTLVPGDRVLVPTDVYGGTYRLLATVHEPAGLRWSAVDLTDPAALDGPWPDDTRLVWLESPTNPRLDVIDVRAVAAAARERGVRVAIDSTFATPYLQRPLGLGADVVVHSTTKYLGGHSDVIGGFVATSDPELADRVGLLQRAAGAVPGPLDCYLVLRGLRTLAVRMERHCDNAEAVARFLAGHPAVASVRYPGLRDHPGHEVARRQMRRFGGMVSFVAAGGEAAARAVAERTRLFTLAESLGGVESLVGYPAAMSHAVAAGSVFAVDPAMVRLSVGIEAAGDLVADLDRALA